MKKTLVVAVVAIVLLAGSVSIASAERWIKFQSVDSMKCYYDADSIGYYRDNIGQTPFIKVKIRQVIQFANNASVDEWVEVVSNLNDIQTPWWHLKDALEKWKQAHPRR